MNITRIGQATAAALAGAITVVAPAAVSGSGIVVQAMASAAVQQPQEGVLVALGDSITFGYNLTDTNGNSTPSHSAFPYLIGRDTGYTISDLGVPGWTSEDLRVALGTPNFARAVQGAAAITLDIGSNDLLRLAGQMHLLDAAQKDPTAPVTVTPEQQAQFTQAIQQFGVNLTSILTTLRSQTQAPIVLYNLYNPFPPGTGLNTVTEQFEQAENAIIAKAAQSVPRVALADVHTAFAGKQAEYVRVAQGDVHPTASGQAVLAQAGESALRALGAFGPGSNEGSGGSSNGTSNGARPNGPVQLVAGTVSPAGSTLSGTLNGSRVTLTVPPSAIALGSEADVTSGPANAVSPLLSSRQRAIAEVGVNFMSFATFEKPFTLTVENPAIPPGAAVFQITGDVLTPVAGAKVTAGKAVIPGKAGADYVIVAPVAETVPGGTSPVTGLPLWPDLGLAVLLVGSGTGLLVASRRQRA
ncbi:GDSL-type esterase/lipase family protein [Alicyclobacillus macrosporangiidus]|uniref:GDSL-type esterase/lipase family protein n=1 Tax=Alicyclobacillus macrosporangiidus TaxID=392015 RepID=UPI00068B6CE5|nr:GDSL-type esterase/lipase family protein [Alicyclobacillus macrosporangiidus]